MIGYNRIATKKEGDKESMVFETFKFGIASVVKWSRNCKKCVLLCMKDDVLVDAVDCVLNEKVVVMDGCVGRLLPSTRWTKAESEKKVGCSAEGRAFVPTAKKKR